MELKTHPLLDALLQQENIKNDRQLAIRLGAGPATLSKIRSRKYSVSDELRIAIMRTFGERKWPLKKLDILAPPSEKQ